MKVILFLYFSLIPALVSLAQAQVFLEQAKVALSVSDHERLNGALIVHNTTSTPITMRVYWEDFEYKAPYDGTKAFLPAGTSGTSASQWVSFSPQEFTLPGFGQQRIDYTVTVPSRIEEGHYGVIFFERSKIEKMNTDNINIVTRIGSLFFIEPKDKNRKADLTDIRVDNGGLKAHFVNQSRVILIPHTTFYVMQGEGLVLLRGESKNLYVPPGVTAPLEIPLKKKLARGKYTLFVNSDLSEGDVVVKEIGLDVDSSGLIIIESTKN